jgi:undecaprenyl-diphosphatase
VALGLLQGATELVPVSSSAHLALVPRVLGWPYPGLDPALRKSFEVALHAGSAPALALAARTLGAPGDRRLLPLTLLPPAAAGFLLERPIEQRLGGPRTVALAQVAAGAALLLADRRPARRRRAGAVDHLAVGAGQALALVPGVSRAGAALTAARLRGLSRPAAAALACRAALPVTAGAAALKGYRAVRGGLPAGSAPALAAGAGASLGSSLAARGALGRAARARSYAPLAAYRIAFGALALALGSGRFGLAGHPLRPYSGDEAGGLQAAARTT